MDMYAYSDDLLLKRFLDVPPFEITNMSGINKASSRGCDNATLTDWFGVLVQGLVATTAFSTLILKRFNEPVGFTRPWRIWFLDISKQAIGALFIHFANIVLSTLKQDPCSLYLMNFLLDATLGIMVIWLAVKLVSSVVDHEQWMCLMFGEYGDPPQAAAWVGQCCIYLLILVLEKGVVTLVLLVPGWSSIQEVLLSFVTNVQLEIVLVIFIVPFIVNCIVFWVVDSLTMRKDKTRKSLDDSPCDSLVKEVDWLPWEMDEASRVLLSVDAHTDPSAGDGPILHVQYAGGTLRPSGVVV